MILHDITILNYSSKNAYLFSSTILPTRLRQPCQPCQLPLPPAEAVGPLPASCPGAHFENSAGAITIENDETCS